MAPAVVLLLPKTGYRNEDFLAAARKLGVEVIHASDVCGRLAEGWDEHPLALRFRDAEAAASELAEEVASRRPLAVVGVDDQSALVAALERVLEDRELCVRLGAAGHETYQRWHQTPEGFAGAYRELVDSVLAGAR